MEYNAKVIDVIDRIPGVKSFRFERRDGLDFKPGQWFFVYLDIEGAETKKPFSFSSSPTEGDYIEFTKRLTGSDFSNRLNSLKKGEIVKLGMPKGNLTFQGEYGKIALLSGGIGITPFRSIIKYASDKSLSSDMILLYGSQDPDNIIFKEDLDMMERSNSLLKVVHTVTCPDAPERGWKGCCGYIDSRMIKKEIPDYEERIFYVCGPTSMVKCLTDILKEEMSIPQNKIKLENFAGY